jgi:predicted DNA-binding transcriptional regulator YafY
MEYGVNPKTIHRDMKSISESIPLINKKGVWHLDTDALHSKNDNLNHSLLAAFAHNMQINVECLEHSNISKDLVAFALEYKHLPKKIGEEIIECITQKEQCRFVYTKEEGSSQRRVDPIKLYVENERWYLVARDYKDDIIKTFLLANIRSFKRLTGEAQTLTRTMMTKADEVKSVWSSSSQEPIPIKLYAHPEAARYLKDTKLHKSQKIEDEHMDGSIEISCEITHKLEILPAIKSWLPYVHILEPQWLQEELLESLQHFQDEAFRYQS